MKNDTDTAALLPCPFCGGEAEMREWDFPYVRYQSRCVACKTTGRTRFNERAKAIAAWNRRATTPPTDDEREGLARAIANIRRKMADEPAMTDDEWERLNPWEAEALDIEAAAALAYLAPIRAREIAAAVGASEARAAAAERERDELRAAKGTTERAFLRSLAQNPDITAALKAGIDEGLASASAQQWQPIETAPKDGTPFIGTFLNPPWRESHLRGEIVQVWWQPQFDAFISGAREMTLAPGYSFEDGSSRQLHSPEVQPVDHWMPYPAPPQPR